MGFKDHDDEINYDEYLSLSDLAHEVRWAALVVNAAIPLGETTAVQPEVRSEQGVLSTHQAADRSALRAIAFEHVLAHLGEFDFKVAPAVAKALLEGRMPEPTGNLED